MSAGGKAFFTGFIALLLGASFLAAGDLIINNPPVVLKITTLTQCDVLRALPNLASCGGVENVQKDSAATMRLLVQFSIASLPANGQVIGATYDANIFASTVKEASPAQISIYIFRATQSWTTSVTWNTQPTISASVTSQSGIMNATVAQVQPYRFDITSLVKGWQAGTFSNFGFVIQFSSDLNAPTDIISTLTDISTVTIQYQLPQATLYPKYSCNGGPCSADRNAGEGLPADLFLVEFQDGPSATFKEVRSDVISTNLSSSVTDTRAIRVKDFFGSIITTQTIWVNLTPYSPKISITYRSLTFYSNRDTFTGLSISSGAGSPLVIDLPPRSAYIKGFRDGSTLTVTFTLKDENGATINNGIFSVAFTMTASRSYLINGTTVSQSILNEQGITTSMTQLVAITSPAVSARGVNMPFVPPPNSWVAPNQQSIITNVDPFYTLIYYTTDTKKGTSKNFPRPYDKTFAYQVLQDQFFIQGTYTNVWLNDTKDTTSTADDTVVFTAASSGLNIFGTAGQNITVACNGCGTGGVIGVRQSTSKITSAFTWTQNSDTKQYTTTTAIKNGGQYNWTNVYLFISFVPGIRTNTARVNVTDLDNAVLLQVGLHYTLGEAGVELAFPYLNSSKSRNFQTSWYDIIQTNTIEEIACDLGQVTQATPAGKALAYQTLTASCYNGNPTTYKGRLVFPFSEFRTYTGAPSPTTLLIYDSAGNNLYPNSRYRGVWDGGNFFLYGYPINRQATITLTLYYLQTPVGPSIAWVAIYYPWEELTAILGIGVGIFIVTRNRFARRRPQEGKGFSRPTLILGYALILGGFVSAVIILPLATVTV